MAKIAKRMKAATAAFEGKSALTVEDAVKLIKGAATAKFDETLEIAMNLGVDPRHADQMVRGVVQLPNGTGKTVRVAVFTQGANAEAAKAAGADVVGMDDLAEQVGGLGVQDDGVFEAETGACPAAHLDGADLAAESSGDLHTQGRFLSGSTVTRNAHGGSVLLLSSTSGRRRPAGRAGGGLVLLTVPPDTDNPCGWRHQAPGWRTFPGRRSTTAASS